MPRMIIVGAQQSHIESPSPSMDVGGLYRRFQPSVYRRVLSFLRDTEEARDVTHDAFLALVQRRRWEGDESAALALLHEIAARRAINRVRHYTRWSARLAAQGTLDVGKVSSESGTHRVEALTELLLLMRGESPVGLTAALLHFAEEYTVKEVAQALALSTKTVSRMLERFVTRARKRGLRLAEGL